MLIAWLDGWMMMGKYVNLCVCVLCVRSKVYFSQRSYSWTLCTDAGLCALTQQNVQRTVEQIQKNINPLSLHSPEPDPDMMNCHKHVNYDSQVSPETVLLFFFFSSEVRWLYQSLRCERSVFKTWNTEMTNLTVITGATRSDKILKV